MSRDSSSDGDHPEQVAVKAQKSAWLSGSALALLGLVMPAHAQQLALRDAEFPLPPTAPIVLSGNDAVQMAERLYAQGKLDEAEAILRRMVDADSEQVDVMQIAFLAGLIAKSRGQYAEAEEIFRTILDHDPSLVRVRLELAQVLFEQKKDRKATYHFHLALANGLPDEVKKKIRAYLSEIESRRVFQISYSAALAQNTNINSGSDLETFDLFDRITFRLGDDARPQSEIGLSQSLSIAAFPKLSKHWRLETRVAGRYVDYDQTRFDDVSLRAEIGPRYQSEKYNASLLATVTRREYAGREYEESIGAKLTLSSALSKRSRFSFRAAYEDVNNAASKGRDGKHYSLGGTFKRALDRKTALAVSVDLQREEARYKTEKNLQRSVRVDLQREMPWGISMQISPEYLYRDYDAVNRAYSPFEREDSTKILSLLLTKRDWRFMGFSPVLTYAYLRNDSNIELFTYDRHSFDVSVTRNLH